MMKRSFLSAACIFSLTFMACHKEQEDCPPGLPCATQTGEDTFGCYINGEPWVAEIGPNIWDPTVHAIAAQYDESAYFMDHNNFLYLKGARYTDNTNGFITISINPLVSAGIIHHSQVSHLNSNGLITYIENGLTTDAISFKLDTLFEYNFEITRLDTVKNIISGKFSFTGTSPNDTIKVSEGRFDVKYDAY
jgi:hypothetical protein